MTNREFCRLVSDLCVKVAYNYPWEWYHHPPWDLGGTFLTPGEWQRRWLAHAYAWNAMEGL